MAVLSLLPHADEPAVPEDDDGAEHGDGGATLPAQVTKCLGDSKWLLPEVLLCELALKPTVALFTQRLCIMAATKAHFYAAFFCSH